MTICSRPVPVDARTGEASASCPSCGHTMLVHPGVHNKGVDACMLCKLAASLPQSPFDALAAAILEGRVQFVPVAVDLVSDGYDSHPVPCYRIDVDE